MVKEFDLGIMQEMTTRLDVDLLGVASVEKPISTKLREAATSLLPGAKSVVVLGKEIDKEVVALLRPHKGAGEAQYGDLLGPHNDYINGRLTRAVYELACFFRKDGYPSLPLPAAGCPTDQRFLTAIFSYKHAAQLAGLGSIGRHSLLITPEHGPRVKLACLLTEARLEASPVSNKDYCVDCDACIRECPAQAIHLPEQDTTYSINKFACQAYRNAGLTCGVCIKVCDEIVDSSQ